MHNIITISKFCMFTFACFTNIAAKTPKAVFYKIQSTKSLNFCTRLPVKSTKIIYNIISQSLKESDLMIQ